MYALRRGFVATTRENVPRSNPSQNKKRQRIFCQKDVRRDCKRYIGIPYLVLLSAQELIFV